MRYVWAVALFLAVFASHAADEKPAPIKALLITGGGWHDYKLLTPHLTSKIAELANVTFEVKWGLDPLKDPKFADGYDIVVYDLCYDNPEDPKQVENALL